MFYVIYRADGPAFQLYASTKMFKTRELAAAHVEGYPSDRNAVVVEGSECLLPGGFRVHGLTMPKPANLQKLEAVLKFFHSVLEESVDSSSFVESMKREAGLELNEAKAVLKKALNQKSVVDDFGEAGELATGTE